MEQFTLSRDVELFPEKNGRITVFHRKTRKTYVLGEKEAQVLQKFDGQHSQEDLVQECSFFSPEEIRQLTEAFHGLELFEGTKRKQKFSLRSLWKMRLRLFSPNQLFRGGTTRAGVAFFLMLLLSICSVAAGVYAIIGSRTGSHPFAVSLADIQAYLLHTHIWDVAVLLFLNGLCLFLHEIAHAITARYYGVSVPEIGVMLYAFIPAAYTNVTGMRLLQKKGQQIMILCAGTIVNFGLIGLSYALLSITGSTVAAVYLLSLVVINAITIFMNLIVFLKFDSYYILEVLLDEPGLQEHAFTHLRAFLKATAHPDREESVAFRMAVLTDSESESRHRLYCVYAVSCVIMIPVLVLGNLLSAVL